MLNGTIDISEHWVRQKPGILEHADIPFQYFQKKCNGGNLCNQIVLYRARSSFLLKIVAVSIIPQTLSTADKSFVWFESVRRTKTSRVQSADIKWSTGNCSRVSDSCHRQAGFSASIHLCQSCETRFWQFQKNSFFFLFFCFFKAQH